MPVTLDVRQRVKQRDGWRCVACQADDRLTIDHIVPKCLGGGNNYENLQTLCEPCNGAKADQVIDFLVMDRRTKEAWVTQFSAPRRKRLAHRLEPTPKRYIRRYDFATDTLVKIRVA